MRLRSRLLIGFGAVLALAVVGLALGLATSLSLSVITERMAQGNFRGVELTSQLRHLTEAHQLVITERLAQPGHSAITLMEGFVREADPLLDKIADAVGEEAAEPVASARAALVHLSTAVRAADQRPPDSQGVPAEVIAAFAELRTASLRLFDLNLDGMRGHARAIDTRAGSLSVALGVLALFTVLIGVLTSFRLADRLSQPMERLAEAAERIREGEFAVRVGTTGLRETDAVAERFDAMADALGRFHALNLEKIVAGRRRLDRVIESIDDGLMIFDAGGVIERINSVGAAQLGIEGDAIVGESFEHAALPPSLVEALGAMLRDPASVPPAGIEFQRGEGAAQRTITAILLPFTDANQTGIVLILRDITALRRFERLRTDFVLRASHELRTPVTGMRMAFSLLDGRLKLVEGSRESELFDTLRGEMKRLVDLLEDLLDLSRLYAHTNPHTPEPLPPAELLDAAYARFAPRAEAAGVRLSVDTSADLPPTIAVDRASFSRVFDNLLGNALRHTPAGGWIRLVARTRGSEVEFTVEDSGEGIPLSQLDRIFEPFVQVGGRRGGAGLGLAICREIVEQHGGRIRADSAPGRGARFEILLRRAA